MKHIASLLKLSLIVALALPLAALRAQPTPCPYPQLSVLSGTDRRPQVEGDYLVIEYNAASRQTFWYDYSHHLNPATLITQNASFLPVVYTKEKIAVHVCNLRFTDQLTVNTSPFAVPEGGADIRGATPAPLPTLTSTLDMIQTTAPTGGATPESGLGFGAPTILASPTVSGVTLGKITRGADGTATYTDGTIAVSGEQVALMMYATVRNGKALIQSIQEIRTHDGSTNAPPGSIDAIDSAIKKIKHEVTGEMGDKSDAAAFDEDVTSVQNLSAQLTALAGSLTAQGFGARAIAVQTNFATLRGILNLAEIALNQEKSGCVNEIPSPTPPTKPKPAPDPSAQSASKPPLFQPIPAEAVQCEAFEQSTFANFLDAYDDELTKLAGDDPKALAAVENWNPTDMFSALTGLHSDLSEIDAGTGKIFNDMNKWYWNSSVEQTDLIAPVTTNTLMRISIIVQRGYTPFTLANNPSATNPAITTAVAAPPAASTSTPAHAVQTVLVEVHRLANFNLAGGVVLIHVPTTSYNVEASPIVATQSSSPTGYTGTCNGVTVNVPAPTTTTGPATYSCIVPTQQSEWQVAGMAGITWYPWGRDYFPRHGGFSNYPRNYMPSLLLATSVTSLGNALGAVNWEPISGIDFFAGIASAHSNTLPSGMSPTTTALPQGYMLLTNTQMHAGFAIGVGFDLGVFTQLFQKTTVPGSTAGLP